MSTTKFKFALVYALNLGCVGSTSSVTASHRAKTTHIDTTSGTLSHDRVADDTLTTPATSGAFTGFDTDARELATTSTVAGPTLPAIPGANPAINRPWKARDLQPMVDRLEHESREIYRHYQILVDALPIQSGMVIADLGAGSGLLTLPLAHKVGESGHVYALDINRALLAEIDRRANKSGVRTIETRLTSQTSVNLTPASIDAVVICDTYHHFETPNAVLRDLQAALRPRGTLVLIDLEKIKGVTNRYLYDHVRAGKEVFRQEIESAGFDFVREIELPQLVENYVLEFRKR